MVDDIHYKNRMILMIAEGLTFAEAKEQMLDYQMGDPFPKLEEAAPFLLLACQEFVRKVEAGEARSTRSYAEMKTAIDKAKGVR